MQIDQSKCVGCLLLNLQGDVIALLNSSGGYVAKYVYDAWGKVLSSTGTLAGENPLRYRGYYYDTDTELYYLGGRYYDPAVKRFINADNASLITANPYGLTDKNLFAYCDNNPVSRKDDGGEFWNFVVGAAVGGLVGGITAAVTSYKETGTVSLASVAIGAGTGAIGGLVGASGFRMGTQALVSGVLAATNNIATARANNQKVNWGSVAFDAGIGAVSSLVGSAVTKKVSDAAEKTLQRGIRRAVSAKSRYDSGSRYWKGAAKRGLQLIRSGSRALNRARGSASVIGSGIGGTLSLAKWLATR